MEVSSIIIEKYFTGLTDEQKQQFEALGQLYTEWNSRINVISRKDIESLYLKHVLHSLALAAIFEFKPGMQIMDIGAGGGFPSVPLAIMYPETEFLAVDSIRKKLSVIEAVANGAGINNIQILHSRAEDIRNRKFDCVVSRAVAPLKDLWQWTYRLMRNNSEVKKDFMTPGSDEIIPAGLICLKGGDLAEEISQSGKRPRIWEIEKIFEEEYFKEKYVLQVV
ncbi:MAG: 16S rRNA (guanine(527)-N(7))-methyltransferase RsmG [Chitinophagaceae bacterium]|jgi:16S rRNA (guanine527-N7)-methyltransferase|nr:16S rRNA (guanine(527)-N(7))-methyltransferase RsmG [Chitinophagaceae bacterium]